MFHGDVKNTFRQSFVFLVNFCKFWPKKHDFDLYKGLFMEKITPSSLDFKDLFFKLSNFNDKL